MTIMMIVFVGCENQTMEDASKEDSPNQKRTYETKIEELPEYTAVQENINLPTLTPSIVKDNNEKRVIIYHNAEGKEVYKSIYVKKKQLFKIIEYSEGEIYKETLNEER